MFTDYSILEIIIFNGVKRFFEKLDPLGSDEYKNGFYDLVAQYQGGGQHYILIEEIYEDLIETTILEEYKKLSGTDKKELQVFYERNFLDNYFDGDRNEYIYTDEELASEIRSRFQSWIDDNFNLDDLLAEDEEEDEEEDYEEEDENESDDVEKNA